ncbi:MAG: 6-phosphofructokinase [Clostridia bacterium]|nr:6-phosphofructokinase [Clostridia bacterium]
MEKIAVLTSGGDSPGMNACIRAVVRTALYYNMDVYGIERGYEGLINGDITRLNHRSVSDIIHKGGTFLKTSRCPEFKDLEVQKRGTYALSAYGIEGLVVIGGDGTFRGAKSLSDNFGIKVMGIPGTIDNDLAYTDYTLGFDTTVNTVLWAINNLRDTMHSHDRVSLLEVMGRNAGDIALYAGIAGGAEYILVPEVPYDLDEIASSIKKSNLRGKTSNTIVLAEGAGDREEIVQKIKEKTGINVKVTVLGYIQRGGSPNMADRVLAAKFAIKAVDLLKNGGESSAIGIKDNKIVAVPFEKAFNEKKVFDKDLFESARILGL